MKWLISDEDFNTLTNNGEWDYCAMFWENGMIKKSDAIYQCLMSKTEWEVPDCPYCQSRKNVIQRVGDDTRFYCRGRKCRMYFTLTTKTFLDNCKLELHLIWRFAWLYAEMGLKTSTLIAVDLGIAQKTAWGLISTLRAAYRHKNGVQKNGNMRFNSYWDVLSLLFQNNN